MRTYDKVIRFYSSWFGDLMSESKEFSDGECWQVIKALYMAEEEENPDLLDALPREIKRALSLETMKTQVAKLIASRRSSAERGRAGAAASMASASRVDAVRMQEESRKEAAKDDAARWLEWADKTPDDRIIDFAKKGRVPAIVWDKLWAERADFVAYMRDKGVRVPPRPLSVGATPAEQLMAIASEAMTKQ